ncbi:hypothetical protein DB346_10430 [Verrucomicrobia bacterium LW23]|nr:hypothetical protein DB346_10430 [Verrucomicrobia bacterium LW23]
MWIDGAQAGPFTEDELRSKDAGGEMSDESILVTTDLGQSWAPVTEFRERWAGLPPVAPSARPPAAALPSAVRTGGAKKDNYPPGYAPTMKFDIPDPGSRPGSAIRRSPAARPASVSQGAPAVQQAPPSEASNVPKAFVPAARPGADKGVVQPSFARDRDIHIGAASTIKIDIPDTNSKKSIAPSSVSAGAVKPSAQQRPPSQGIPSSLAAAANLPPAPAIKPQGLPPAGRPIPSSVAGAVPGAGAASVPPAGRSVPPASLAGAVPGAAPAGLPPAAPARPSSLATPPASLAGKAPSSRPAPSSGSASASATPASDSTPASEGADAAPASAPARPGSTAGKKGISPSMNAAVSASASNLAAMVKAAEAASEAAAANPGAAFAKPIEVDPVDPYAREDLASQIGMLGGVLLLAGAFCPFLRAAPTGDSVALRDFAAGYGAILLGIIAIFLAWDRRFIGLWGTSVATVGLLAYFYFAIVPTLGEAPEWQWGIGIVVLGIVLQIVSAALSMMGKKPTK